MRTRLDRFRDRISCHASNWILNHVATQWYRDSIDTLVELGLMTAVRDPERMEHMIDQVESEERRKDSDPSVKRDRRTHRRVHDWEDYLKNDGRIT